jgi:hypothetical protein
MHIYVWPGAGSITSNRIIKVISTRRGASERSETKTVGDLHPESSSSGVKKKRSTFFITLAYLFVKWSADIFM